LTRLREAPSIIVIDDEPSVRDVLQLRLERAGYKVATAGGFPEFKQIMAGCDVVLCDIILRGDDGLKVLKWSRQHHPDTVVIIMTGKPTYETAAEAIRLGAYDYLAKPINKEDLLLTVERAVRHRQLKLEKERLEQENEAYRLHLEQRVAEQTQALRKSREFLARLTDTMADAVLSLKIPGYCLEYVNQAVAKIFGYQPEELMGQSIETLYPDPYQFYAFNQSITSAIAARQPQFRFEQSMRKKNGKAVWTEMIATFIYDGSDQPSQMICVIRDITQRSMLLGVVAHELRGPLGLISGFSQAILDDIEHTDSDSIKKHLQVINNNADRMLKMLGELLDITKIELGAVSLQLEAIDLGVLLRQQKDNYLYVARKKEIILKEKLPSESLICNCDALKIGQVLSNFIDNAIKYSNPGTTIEIIGHKQDTQVWVGVRDEGPGIKAEEIKHLFKSFEHNKISSKPTAGEKSSGLGLAISKKIIEAHHGEIGVDSTPGQGSTFWFALPADV
jgi:PAS domain S-box-containing protein